MIKVYGEMEQQFYKNLKTTRNSDSSKEDRLKAYDYMVDAYLRDVFNSNKTMYINGQLSTDDECRDHYIKISDIEVVTKIRGQYKSRILLSDGRRIQSPTSIHKILKQMESDG